MLGRVRLPSRSPTSTLLCSPPTPCPLQPRLRFPLPATYLVAGACSMPTWADDTCTRLRVVRRRPLTGSPQHRGFFEERRGPPRLLDRPLRACYGRTPRRIQAPSSPRQHLHAGVVVAFDEIQLSRHPGSIGFGAAVPRPARSHAYASQTPSLGSAPGLLPARAGSPLAGRISHPLDDERSFMKSPHLQSPSTSSAWSH